MVEPGEATPPLNGDVDQHVLNPATHVMEKDNIAFNTKKNSSCWIQDQAFACTVASLIIQFR